MNIDRASLDRTLALLKNRLLQSRTPDGFWQGRLSGSALSTATAVFALATVDKSKYNSLIRRGIDWLSENQNPDGGWGDTIRSISNISTTLLCLSAFTISEPAFGGQGEALDETKPGGTAIPSTMLRTSLAESSRAGSPCHGQRYKETIAKAQSWLTGFAGQGEA
ncbi:MAG: hypothetical protein NTX52_02685, partial [Planctomycetota bacterium]|nr:hypothetical protein [Planctomycetota bacterium]